MTVSRRFQSIFSLSLILTVLSLWHVVRSSSTVQAKPPSPQQFGGTANCPPLPPPTGNILNVTPSQAGDLDEIVQNAVTGDTILLADGTYELHGDYLLFATPGVTLRSAGGDREAVVIDGDYKTTEIALILASNVTIADMTLRQAMYHPIHVTGSDSADTENTLIYNVHVSDPGQQAIKINQNDGHYADNGVVACSHIELTDAGRPFIWQINGSCYTGGIDGHQAWGWVIRDNWIEGFWCDQGLSEHAIHFWTGSRDTLVERNTLKDNARGVGFGLLESGGGWRTYSDNPCPGATSVGHYDGIIRNNFIFQGRAELQQSQAGLECGVCLEQACGTQVFHNTAVSTAPPFSSIEWRFANTNAEISNNLVSHNLMERDGATAVLTGNLADAPLSLFVNASTSDLHLLESATAAIDQGVSIASGMSADDIDGQLRDAAPDIGADEFVLIIWPYHTYLPATFRP